MGGKRCRSRGRHWKGDEAIALANKARHLDCLQHPLLHRSRFRQRRSHDAVIRIYDDAGNVIETHERKGEFKEW